MNPPIVIRHERVRSCQCRLNSARGMGRLRCGHNSVTEVYWTIEGALGRWSTRKAARAEADRLATQSAPTTEI